MNQDDPVPDNRRFSVRSGPRSKTRARFHTVGGPDAPNLALAVLDLSETGARFLLATEVTPNWHAEVTFQVAGQPRPFRLTARIVWCTPAPDGSGFQAGIQFRQRLSLGVLRAIASELSDAQ